MFLVLFTISLYGQVAQYRGENRDGQYNETGLMKVWPEEGPELLFSVNDIGSGFSTPVQENGTIYVTGKKDTLDYLTAIDLNGEKKYSVPFARSWSQSFAESRSIPTIIDGKALVVGGSGVVVCLDAESGSINWSVDVFGDFDGKCGTWGIAESPLVVDNKVIYTPGGSQTTMVALDLNSGAIVWTTESLRDTAAYVAPIVFEYAGNKVIAGMTAKYVFAVDAADGSFLWTHKYYDEQTPLWHPVAPVINCVSPLYKDGQLYVTSGYNHVGVMYQLNPGGEGVDIIWTDTILDNHHGGVVLVDGYIYGSNWLSNANGNWCAIDWETGKAAYEKEWQCKGSIIFADGLLYCFEEKRGNMALVKPTPDDFEIISSFRITKGSGPYWAHPSIYNGKLLVRHGDVLMVYNIAESK